MSKEKQEGKEATEILINKLYSGNDFLENENNIGHEVINFFTADNGNHYVYVTPYGDYSLTHQNKIKTILFVRLIDSSHFEVIGKTNGKLEDVLHLPNGYKCATKGYDKLTDNERMLREQIREQQCKYIKENEIAYEGVLVNDVHYENKDDKLAFYLTYKVDSICVPRNSMYLTSEKLSVYPTNTYYVKPKSSAIVWRQKSFYNVDDKGYEVLNSIIKDDSLWKEKETKANVEQNSNQYFNFLKIIKKENDEVIFSNMLEYFFNKDNLIFQKFVNEVLFRNEKVIENFSSSYSIQRECEKIDLLIRDKNNIIVIENKVRSKINGLEKYNKSMQEIIPNNSTKKGVRSQLSDYYEKAKQKAISGEVIHCFIFYPDYNHLDITKYADYNHYIKIKYSEIYNFFKDNPIKDNYFEDFINALHKHNLPYNNDLYEEMQRRFFKKIQEAKEQQ